MTERELDRTKGELVRALRRRAAELDAQEGALLAARSRTDRPARVVREPNGRQAHQVAFFARHTFRFVATAGATPAARVTVGE